VRDVAIELALCGVVVLLSAGRATFARASSSWSTSSEDVPAGFILCNSLRQQMSAVRGDWASAAWLVPRLGKEVLPPRVQRASGAAVRESCNKQWWRWWRTTTGDDSCRASIKSTNETMRV
jgi:hypothetical protein